ncbi:MAG: AI-2E family transporter [Planctomycetota bacterium]
MSDTRDTASGLTAHPVIIAGVAVIAFVALTQLLMQLQVILVPFVLAGFFYFSISPLLDYLVQRMKWPGFVAIPATFLIALAVLGVAGTVIYGSASQMARDGDDYTRRLNTLIDRAERWVPMEMLGLVPDDLDTSQSAASESTATAPATSTAPAVTSSSSAQPAALTTPSQGGVETRVESLFGDGTSASAPDDVESAAASDDTDSDTLQTGPGLAEMLGRVLQDNVGPMLQGIAQSALSIVSNGILILILMFFMMLGRVVSVQRAGGLVADIEGGVKGYVILKTIISAFTGLAQGAALYFFGVELAIVFGLLGFLFNFIPNIGPFLATLAPVPMVLLDLPDPLTAASIWWAILAIGIPGAIHFTSGLLETRFMGERFDVHPVVVMLGLMYFGLVWGIVGAFLSTPILAVIRILCSKSETFKPVALALAGKLDEVYDGSADEAK